MKYRKGFVTNSSSSSFLIAKKYLTNKQIEAIEVHYLLGEKLGIPYSKSDAWSISQNEDFITGSTYLDNFDMLEFLEKIDVNLKKVVWGSYSFDLNDCYKYYEEFKNETIKKSINWEIYLENLFNNEDD